jgi:Fur family transcriptional regulator, ferric uptake regulator
VKASTAWVDHASAELARAGYRRGGARQAVLELLASQDCALSALDIEDALRGGDRRVARASVYRILDELVQLDLVARVDLGRGTARYEPAHDDARHHHDHLVCDGCGELIPFRDEELERALRRVSERVPFEVAEHEVVLHGRCGSCGD